LARSLCASGSITDMVPLLSTRVEKKVTTASWCAARIGACVSCRPRRGQTAEQDKRIVTMSVAGTKRTCQWRQAMSASLIGHSGSSAFRLSTTAVSMSLAGSRFSPDSAPRPFHHGFRRRGGTIFRATLPSM